MKTLGPTLDLREEVSAATPKFVIPVGKPSAGLALPRAMIIMLESYQLQRSRALTLSRFSNP